MAAIDANRGASTWRLALRAPRWTCAVGTAVALGVVFASLDARAGEACPGGCESSCELGRIRDGVCDARGECALLSARPCPGGFACGSAHECSESCYVDSECASGYACTAEHECEALDLACEGHALVRHGSRSQAFDCAPYACSTSTNRCVERCASDADCAAPNGCDARGRCSPKPPSDTTDAGVQSCAVVPGAGATRTDAWVLMPLALGALALVSSLARRLARRQRAAPSARSLPPARPR